VKRRKRVSVEDSTRVRGEEVQARGGKQAFSPTGGREDSLSQGKKPSVNKKGAYPMREIRERGGGGGAVIFRRLIGKRRKCDEQCREGLTHNERRTSTAKTDAREDIEGKSHNGNRGCQRMRKQ